MDATVTDHIRQHLLATLGMGPMPRQMPSLEVLRKQQWAPRFERLRRNRMVMGAFRYGLLSDQPKAAVPYDNVGSLIARARSYQTTGNVEHLVDIANLAMIEFKVGRHPTRHFRSVDDGDHTQRKG